MTHPPSTILHSCSTWLPRTQNWLYNQASYLHGVKLHVACETTANLDTYQVQNLHVGGKLPGESGLLEHLLHRPVIGYPVRAWRRFAQWNFRRRIIEDVGADLLHSHFGPHAWLNLHAIRRTGIKHVVTFYGYDVQFFPNQYPIWYERYRELFAEVDLVLAEGPHMAQCIVHLGCSPEKVRVHHLGIEVDHIQFRPRRWTRESPLRILMAAGFREKKGIPYGLRAIARLTDEMDISVTVIGDATPDLPRSQAEKECIMATVDEYNLHDQVNFRGFCSHKELMKTAYDHHIFLCPSITGRQGDTEGGAPVAIIEMAASGMPVVSTEHCDIPEVIEHGRSGLLAEERDVAGLAEHLRWLSNHPEQWRELVGVAREHIERKFDAKRQGHELSRIYREVLNSDARTHPGH